MTVDGVPSSGGGILAKRPPEEDMLHLMESARPARSRGGRWMAVSSAVHAALIATAVAAGTSQVIARAPDAPPDRIIFAAPRPPRAPAAPMSHGSPGAHSAPVQVRIPDVIIPRSPFSIDEIARQPSPPRILPIATGDPGLVGSPFIPKGIFDEHSVDRAVIARPGNRSPDYPTPLRSAGVSGEVLVRFVVDTTGRVESGSIEIVNATHPLFAEAVTGWLPRTRYEPAQAGGARVRQRVEQRIDFALRP
jgi:protein TonB